MMTNDFLNRRRLLQGTAATAAVAATASTTDLLGFAKAWAAESPFKPEKGAKLQLTRWKRFVQSRRRCIPRDHGLFYQGDRRCR